MKVSFGFDALEFQSHFVFRPSKVRKLIRTNQFHVKNTKMGAGRNFVTLQSMCQGLTTRAVRRKLVLNKDSSHTKACWEKSLSLGEALYSFVERSEWF